MSSFETREDALLADVSVKGTNEVINKNKHEERGCEHGTFLPQVK